MIIDPRFVSYMDSLSSGNNEFLTELEISAKKDRVPIIRTSMQQFLKTIIYMTKPKAILEVGAAIGFSSCLMATYNPEPCKIITIENYEKRIPIAKENIKKAGFEDVITLLCGDAKDILPSIQEQFDLIFMDAAKAQYPVFYPEVKRLLKPGGILISDNVLQDGDIIESKFAVTRRNRTIHKRMRDYLYTITHDEDMVTTILPISDGVTISVKK